MGGISYQQDPDTSRPGLNLKNAGGNNSSSNLFGLWPRRRPSQPKNEENISEKNIDVIIDNNTPLIYAKEGENDQNNTDYIEF